MIARMMDFSLFIRYTFQIGVGRWVGRSSEKRAGYESHAPQTWVLLTDRLIGLLRGLGLDLLRLGCRVVDGLHRLLIGVGSRPVVVGGVAQTTDLHALLSLSG